MFRLDVKDDVNVNSKVSFKRFHLILCDVNCMHEIFLRRLTIDTVKFRPKN